MFNAIASPPFYWGLPLSLYIPGYCIKNRVHHILTWCSQLYLPSMRYSLPKGKRIFRTLNRYHFTRWNLSSSTRIYVTLVKPTESLWIEPGSWNGVGEGGWAGGEVCSSNAWKVGVRLCCRNDQWSGLWQPELRLSTLHWPYPICASLDIQLYCRVLDDTFRWAAEICN